MVRQDGRRRHHPFLLFPLLLFALSPGQSFVALHHTKHPSKSPLLPTPRPQPQPIRRTRIHAGSSAEADAAGWRAVETEVKILLDKIARAGRVMSLGPEEEATRGLTEYLDKLIDERGSPVPLSTLAADGGAVAGRWRLAFTTDPRATFFGNPLVGGSTVELSVSPRDSSNQGGPGSLEQRISLGGKPGLRGLATYRVDPATGYFSYDFTSIKATVFGREVAVPGFVVDKSSSFIDTSYFDGTLWVERFFAQGPDGPSSKDPVAYNCWRREKGE